jgi:phosphate transport system ATP-binding protein
MVFQQPNPFRKSIRENIAFAPKRHGLSGKANIDALVEESLRAAALWDEVKDKLDQSAYALSGGQQQRLCIARTLAMHPDVVLMDEPCSALDPIATYSIEETIRDMAKRGICVVIVTHNMEQAARVSDRTAFFLLGDMVEFGPTPELFSRPKDKRLDDYLTGRFG